MVMGIAVILAVGLGLGISLGAFRGDGPGGTSGVSSSTTVAELGVTSTTASPAGSGAGDPSGDTEDGAGAGDEAPTGSGLPADGAPINTSYAGLSMFRGNGHRSFYGTGPLPTEAPRVLWRFPEGGPMSSSSSEGGESRVWAGTGWTGQPVVV